MTKVQKRFEFEMPITKTVISPAFTLSQIWKRGTTNPVQAKKIGELIIGYVGYDYKLSAQECEETGEDRYNVDVDSIRYEGVDLYDMFQSDMFEELREQIHDAAMNNVAYQFENYRLAKAHLKPDELD